MKGGCWKVAGIPILEWGEAGQECQRIRNERKETEEASDVEKKRIEEESDVLRTFARNYGTGQTPFEGAFAAGASAYGQIGSSVAPFALAGATGGLSAIPQVLGDLLGGVGDTLGLTDPATGETDLMPVVLGVGALVVVAMVLSNQR